MSCMNVQLHSVKQRYRYVQFLLKACILNYVLWRKEKEKDTSIDIFLWIYEN